MDVRTILAVASGAAIGGVLRLLITTLVVGRFGSGLGFYATLGINVVGSYFIGFVLGLAQQRVDFDPLLRVFLAVGVLGGFTTFSSFAYETLRMVTTALALTAVLYVSGSVFFGLAAAFLGAETARTISH